MICALSCIRSISKRRRQRSEIYVCKSSTTSTGKLTQSSVAIAQIKSREQSQVKRTGSFHTNHLEVKSFGQIVRREVVWVGREDASFELFSIKHLTFGSQVFQSGSGPKGNRKIDCVAC